MNLRRRPVESPSSYALIRMRSRICGCCSSACVMLSVPVPPEKSTTSMRVRVPEASGAWLKGSGIRPPEKRLDAAGIGGGIDSHGLLQSHQARCEHTAGSAGREGDDREEVEFGGAPSPRGRVLPNLAEQAPEHLGLEAEETAIAFALAGHRVAFTRLQESGDAAGLIALEMDVRFGTEHGGYGQVRGQRPLVEAQDGFHGCAPQRNLVAPNHASMGSGHFSRSKLYGVAHSGGFRLNHDAAAAGCEPLDFRFDIGPAVGGEHENHGGTEWQQQVKQPFEDGG